MAAENYLSEGDMAVAESLYIAAARQMVMSIAQRQGMSTTRIGKLLQRDHTTVMHGIAAHEKRVRSIAQSTE